MKYLFAILLSLLSSCERVENRFSKLEYDCGPGTSLSTDLALIDFGDANLSDINLYLQSSGKFVTFEVSRKCIGLNDEMGEYLLVHNSSDDSVFEYEISRLPRHKVTEVIFSPLIVPVQIWKQCGSIGMKEVPAKAFRISDITMEVIDLHVFPDQWRSELEINRFGCFSLEEQQINEGFVFQDKNGNHGYLYNSTFEIASHHTVYTIPICTSDEGWDIASGTCVGSGPTELIDYFSSKEKAMLSITELEHHSCSVTLEQGVRNCVLPTLFESQKNLWWHLHKLHILSLNDDKVNLYPAVKRILSSSIWETLRVVEESKEYHPVFETIENNRRSIQALTGIVQGSVVGYELDSIQTQELILELGKNRPEVFDGLFGLKILIAGLTADNGDFWYLSYETSRDELLKFLLTL